MIECGFFDDEQPDHEPTDALPRWASITEISDLLDVSRNTISTAIKRAWANNEPWIKKEKAEDGNVLYLIDTHHEMYLSHQKRWKQQKDLRTELLDEPMTTWSHAGRPLFSSRSSEETSFPSHATIPRSWHKHTGSEEVFLLWPHFRQWLSSCGVQVFQNLLAEEEQEKSWQWRWNDLHAEGYHSVEEAIIAALQHRLDTKEEKR